MSLPGGTVEAGGQDPLAHPELPSPAGLRTAYPQPDPQRLGAALQEANIPTLVAVLAHLTGDDKWTKPPYLPTRTKGLSDHATGGLTASVQKAVREAAYQLFTAAEALDLPPVPLSDDRLTKLMSACMGEPIPAEYAQMMAEEMGLQSRYHPERIRELPDRDDYSIVIVGAGASGLCLAVQLKQAGIPFTILEKNEDVGGTWFENRYPDCGVDTPSYWYSYSFDPINWDRLYARRDAVQTYLRRAADRFGVSGNIQFGTRVQRARFEEATDSWHIEGVRQDGSQLSIDARFLVTAVGQLNQPKIPSIPGADRFRGAQFHSAAWPDDVSIKGKRVAVVGTGASSMQIVPAIAGEVAHLTVFQRSPQWVAPNSDYTRRVSEDHLYLMTHVPCYSAWYRMRQAWIFGDKVYSTLIRDPNWRRTDRSINSVNEGHRQYFTGYVRAELDGRPDLLAKSLPDYPPFGKRMLLDAGWFTTLRQPNVTLETDSIAAVEEGGIRTTDGQLHPVDVIVYATGFDSLNLLGSLDIEGRNGATIREQWGTDDARAYLGVTEYGFPNMFMLYGPNTNVGHGGSLLFITECHVRYLMALLEQLIAGSATRIECRKDVRDKYNEEVDAAHADLIWSHPGMRNWYRNDHGRVVTNSPWRLLDLWEMTKEPRMSDYEVRRADAAADAAAS